MQLSNAVVTMNISRNTRLNSSLFLNKKLWTETTNNPTSKIVQNNKYYMGPYDSKLCIPPTNNHLLAVQQQPLVLNEKYWSSGEEEKKKGKKKKGMRMDN